MKMGASRERELVSERIPICACNGCARVWYHWLWCAEWGGKTGKARKVLDLL